MARGKSLVVYIVVTGDPFSSQSHRMVWNESDLKDSSSNPYDMGRDTFHQIRLLRAGFISSFNAFKGAASTACTFLVFCFRENILAVRRAESLLFFGFWCCLTHLQHVCPQIRTAGSTCPSFLSLWKTLVERNTETSTEKLDLLGNSLISTQPTTAVEVI